MKLCATQRELLAVVRTVKHLRPNFYGQQFRVGTHYASLLWLCRKTKPIRQVVQWLENLP